MKVVLYESSMKSFFGMVCSIVTNSPYSHGAIYNDGKLYDSTFKRGYFGVADNIYNYRQVVVVDISGLDPSDWINKNINAKYDTLGLLLWPFNIGSWDKLYCFEVVVDSLKSVGIDLDLGKRKDGKSIVRKLIDRGYKAELMFGKEFNERYLSND